MDIEYLGPLAEEENAARLSKKQAADEAVEEYLLGRLERQRNPSFPAPSVKDVCRKYKVSRGMVEWRIQQLRRLERSIESGELEVAPPMAKFLSEMLGTMAEIQARKKRLKQTGPQATTDDN